jgi:F0F1-type ATP synthase membrane subunit c/vacuolar-type H+-ATPase subunit K
MQQSRIFVGMVLILIFAEVLGLYGSVHSLTPPWRDTGTRCHLRTRWTLLLFLMHALTPSSLIVALILNTAASG